MVKLEDLTPIDISENGALALVMIQTYAKSPNWNKIFTHSLLKKLEGEARKTTAYFIKNPDGTVSAYYVNGSMKLYYLGTVPFEIFE